MFIFLCILVDIFIFKDGRNVIIIWIILFFFLVGFYYIFWNINILEKIIFIIIRNGNISG